MKIRKYFRGQWEGCSPFVFIASVIWLLFDMAALRMSMGDASSSSSVSLKELVVRERLALKGQTTRVSRGGFQAPRAEGAGL